MQPLAQLTNRVLEGTAVSCARQRGGGSGGGGVFAGAVIPVATSIIEIAVEWHVQHEVAGNRGSIGWSLKHGKHHDGASAAANAIVRYQRVIAGIAQG